MGGNANAAKNLNPSQVRGDVGSSLRDDALYSIRKDGARRRKAVDWAVGPLGARCQQNIRSTGQRMGGEGESRRPDRLYHWPREQAFTYRLRGIAGEIGS